VTDLVVYCADIGSVKAGNFGWARLAQDAKPHTNTSIEALIEKLAGDLTLGRPVAMGFECPLWIPLPPKCEQLGSARRGESGKGVNSRPWSAAGGAAVLTTGAAQVPWLLRALTSRVPTQSAFLDWPEFEAEKRGLFLWEAFVSGDSKADKDSEDGHWKDALTGAQGFESARNAGALEKGEVRPPDNADHEVVSLIGAAMLHTDWSDDPALLSKPCLVVKAS
jgi:hypothetical protein